MSWLDVLRARPDLSTSGAPNVADYRDPESGRVFRIAFSETFIGGAEGGERIVTRIGYISHDGKPWYPGQRASIHGLDGAVTGSFEIEDPNAVDWGLRAAMLVVGAIALGAAAWSFGLLPGAPAGAAPTASLGTTAATTAATTAGTTAAATTAAATTTAGTTAATIATGAKVIGAALPLLGAVGGSGGAGTSAGGAPPLQSGPPGAALPRQTVPGGMDNILLIAAGLAAFVAFG
ncbi:MAG: hypothetical protein NDJ19_00650 [Ramlibacter sp.]|nr:hypothetical protein [Ramlibacter sp.]